MLSPYVRCSYYNCSLFLPLVNTSTLIIYIMKMPNNIKTLVDCNSHDQSKPYKKPKLEADLGKQTSLSDQSREFLTCIATSQETPLELKRLPLLRILTQTAQVLEMNELEIAYWSIVLNKWVWNVSNYLKEIIIFSGLAVKKILNQNVELLEKKLEFKYYKFREKFQSWSQRHFKNLSVSPIKLNSEYLKLSAKSNLINKELLNYNFYVDEILQIAPSNYEESEDLECDYEEDEEDEEFKLPQLMSLNSVLREATSDIPEIYTREILFEGEFCEDENFFKFRKSDEEINSPAKLHPVVSDDNLFRC